MTDVEQDKGGLIFLRAGSTIAFLAATSLLVFGRSLLGAMALLEGPVEHLADDLMAVLASAASYGLGLVLSHRGLAKVVARRGISGLGKKMLIFNGLLTTVGAAVLLIGFWQARTGLYRRGRPFVPSPAQVEALVRMGLAVMAVGFGLIAAARGIVAFVARSTGRSAIHLCWVSPRINVLRKVAFLTVVGFVLLMASSCKHGQAAAFIASPSSNHAALETMREVYTNLDILLQHALGAGVCLILLGFLEIAIASLLPRSRPALMEE